MIRCLYSGQVPRQVGGTVFWLAEAVARGLADESRIADRAAAEAIADRAEGFAGPPAVERGKKRRRPPRLLDLPALQKRCGGWGWTADRTSALRSRSARVDERLFTVVGVLADTPETYALPYQLQANNSVFVPITTVPRIDLSTEIGLIVARAAPGVHHADAARDVQAYFGGSNGGLALRVTSAEQLIEQMESQLGLMTLLLGAVGSISLIVGGIGVMNIMLISVAERRREIGIRRALGATRGDIQGQFLIEAVILTLCGGLAGIVVGTGATFGVCRFTGWESFLSPTSIAIGVGVSSVVGVFFGFQPAYQASRLDPIVALQGE